MLSRSGRSNPDGKLSHRIDIPMTEDLHDAVSALATLEGKSKAEWLRELAEEKVYGRLSMVRRVACNGAASPSYEYRTGRHE